MAGINRGELPSRTVRFKTHDLLVTTNRQTGGESYQRFTKALDRLTGTLIKTNIKTDGRQIVKGFGVVDDYEIIYDDPVTKRMIELEVTLSEWLYNSVLGQEVLSINRDYFRLRKPIERRIYEIARKHCGLQKKWQIGLNNLHKKVGSASSIRKFKQSINHIIKHGHLPDYTIKLEQDNVVFIYTGSQTIEHDEKRLHLKPDTIEKAKKILQQQYDVYALEYEWREWWGNSEKTKLKSPDGAFINFCKKRMEQVVEQTELF
jgi:plasmid replication initiation protein